jgi:hypothetical protein
MGDDVWFLHHEGEQLGPMSWAELQELAARGEVEPEDLLWQPSLPSWEPAGTIKGLRFAPESGRTGATLSAPGSGPDQAGDDAAPIYLQPVGSLLRFLHRMLPVDTIDLIDRRLAMVGNIAYACAAVLTAVLMVVLGIRGRSPSLIVFAAVTIPIALLLSYSAVRLLTVMRHRLDTTPTFLKEGGFLEGLATVALGAGVALFSVGLAGTLLGAGVVPLIVGVGGFLVLLYAAVAALDPRALTITDRDETGAGSEALAAMETLTKLVWLRLLPIVYAAAAVTGALIVLWLLIGAFGASPPPDLVAVWVCGRVLVVAMIPAIAWLGFQMVWMVLDVLRSLVSGRTGGGVKRVQQ